MKKDILDEDFDGDLDLELEEVDKLLAETTPEIYIGELVDTELKQKYDVYACTDIKLIVADTTITLVGQALDVTGDIMFEITPISFNNMQEAVNYLKLQKLHNCKVDLDSLRN